MLDISILDGIFGDDPKLINTSLYSQPIIFSVEYALTKLWEKLGVTPNVVVGHSIGEYTAACCAGLISLNDAVRMIAQRGKMMESIDMEGKMLGILTNEENIKNAIKESGCNNVSIAAVNAPENVTISGPSQEVDMVVSAIQSKHRVFINQLNIAHPYHSPMMKAYEDVYSSSIGDILFADLHDDMISSISGKLENTEHLGNKSYWVEHLSKSVNFHRAILEASRLGVEVFIEIGGDATLSGLANQCINDEEAIFVPSLRKGLRGYEQLFDSISKLYVKGFDFDWNSFHKTYVNKKVGIPNYQFQKKKLWREVNSMENLSQPQETQKIPIKNKSAEVSQNDRSELTEEKENLKLEIKKMIQMLTWLENDEIEDDLNLFELGCDSLVLVSLNKQIHSKYNLDISLNEFFTDLDTVEKIAGYIFDHTDNSLIISEETNTIEALETPAVMDEEVHTAQTVKDGIENASPDNLKTIQDVFNNQIQIMDGQLEIIKNMTDSSGQVTTEKRNYLSGQKKMSAPQKNLNKPKQQINTDNTSYVPFKKTNIEETEQLDDLKLKYIKNVEKKYINLSAKSKEATQHYRSVYANNRNIAGFRPVFKEMIYQIVAEKGMGSLIRDIDGNSLIDLTMGFGVNLFGHNPDFIHHALEEELNNGMPLRPMGRLAGTVAEKINELTGVERVAFYNSGTEANMVAARIARAATGRKKIVVFAGSYHGTYDGLLGLPSYNEDGNPVSIPLAPGIMDSMVSDLIVLQYDDEHALDFIKNNADDIAGVLVETVQSRKPDIQPRDFLLKLRGLTEEFDIALMFDEIITGFRIAPGGAQEYFGIKADIVTYGKVAGGGMPIGIVSGKAKYLDSIDGGMWQYGDHSVPPRENKRTFVAGTFSHHPMAMAAAAATLTHIKKNKDHMYTELNGKTDRFAEHINAYFEKNHIPMKVVHFGSLFRFVFQGDFEIFFYGLLEKGIYIWEGRNCFFSTEHTEEDIDAIILAIKRTVEEMRQAGYFGDLPPQKELDIITPEETSHPQVYPMSNMQKGIYAQSLVSENDPNTIVSALKFTGEIEIT